MSVDIGGNVRMTVQLRLGSIQPLIEIKSPWAPVVMYSLLEQVAFLNRELPMSFMTSYFPDSYKEVEYRCGTKDLIAQFILALGTLSKCGSLVHPFWPQTKADVGVRDHAISLAYRRGSDTYRHLNLHPNVDAVVILVEDLFADLTFAIEAWMSSGAFEVNAASVLEEYPPATIV